MKYLKIALTAGSFLMLSVNAYAGDKDDFNDCKKDSFCR